MSNLSADDQRSECEVLAQKFRDVSKIISSMREQSAEFMQSPTTQPSDNIADLTAGFENDLYEYRNVFVKTADDLVWNYLEQCNRGAWAHFNGLEPDNSDGRFTFTGTIDIRDETFTYFPALIKKVDGDVHLGEGITEVNCLEEIYGFMHAYTETDFHANRLKNLFDLHIFAENTVELNKLQNVRYLTLHCPSVVMPSLETAVGLEMKSIKEGSFELPVLTSIDSIKAGLSKKISIPKVLELFELQASQATAIHAPELKKVNRQMNICGLDPKTPFRDAFKNLAEIGKKNQVSVYVRDGNRKREIESLKGHGLAYTGLIEIGITQFR
jgi:hypothetical protein